jgi:hypothetical protein
MANLQVFSQPVSIPSAFAPPDSVQPPMLRRGILLGVMAGAVVIGAFLAWLLFGGR